MNPGEFRLVEYLVVFFILGGVGGFASGLFGIGGGIVRIPIFALLFPAFGVHGGMEMHVAAATSLALAVPSGILALRKHKRLGNFDPAYFRTWALGLLVGVFVGLAISHYASTGFLKIAFIVFLLLMAVYFGLVPDRFVVSHGLPTGPVKGVLSGCIGAYCVMIGIAGGSLAAPVLKLFSMPMARALAIGSGTSMVVSAVGTVGGIWNGRNVPGRPEWAFGYIDVLVLLVMLPGVLFVTPLGVGVGSRMNARNLKYAYAIFLVIIAATMIVHAWAHAH
jgi:uncharacterized protein